MSYKTWHTYGYGICTDDVGECSPDRMEKLLRKAPHLHKDIHAWMLESDITDPAWDDYMEYDQDYDLGLATILQLVIQEAEGLELTPCDNLNGEQYLLYAKSYPWQMNWREKFLSEKHIAHIIRKYVRILTDQPIDIDYYEVENGG